MRNVIRERPNADLHGRLKKTFEFIDKSDIHGRHIVDVGCGYGWFELNAFKKGAKQIIGVEISDEDLATVSKHIKDVRFKPMIGVASKIPVENNKIDTVVAWEVIEHVPKSTENEFFKEVYRILKKDGTFYISTPYNAPLSTYLDPAFWLDGHRHYSVKKLVEYGINNSFSVEKVLITGGIWTALSVINMYISKWIFRRPKFASEFFAKRVNEEYERIGFYNIFIKYRKK